MEPTPLAARPKVLHPLADILRREIDGDVLFSAADRGRYATDASIYQIMPVGVAVPRNAEAARAAMQIAIEQGVPVLPRGAGTSQCGQTVGAALVIDCTKYLNQVLSVDAEKRLATVQPGLVLDTLNARLKAMGLWFPVDVSTAAQATLGGMAGNNSCGSRSIQYGNMVHNVAGIDAVLADGSREHFGLWNESTVTSRSARFQKLASGIHAICEREREEIAARFPPLLRRVAGYNLDIFAPQDPRHYDSPVPNLAHLLVGSEGTLAMFESLQLKLSPLPARRVLGVVNFPTFYRAMEMAQHIVTLAPTAVELVDRTMIDLARSNPAFQPVIETALRGEPQAILITEFSGESVENLIGKLRALDELMADHGLPGCVVHLVEPKAQRDLWEVRKAGLNIMMSMRGEGKPVSFIEDCCVPLAHLADYTQRLTEVFERHGTRGTWYAHASVGTLHVRPILNMRGDGATKMRAIAEEAADLVREYKGVYSGEHGDGLVRSEWIAPFFGPRLTRALGEIKALFDPGNLMNPGKIVNSTRQDDRTLFRYQPGYRTINIQTALDWQGEGGLPAAVEMCNNNDHCRKFDAGTMCPSYRVTGDEQHVTRGRANTLRLALSGQLGESSWTSDAVAQAMSLCVGCKGCKRECPTGVDMSKMKLEYLHHRHQEQGLSLRDKLISHLPFYAATASKTAWIGHLREIIPGARWLTGKVLGLSAKRRLPVFARRNFLAGAEMAADQRSSDGKEVVLLADTFNNYFEPQNLDAALAVLRSAGYRVHIPGQQKPGESPQRPLCCGRTLLATGQIDAARAEARRVIDALQPFVERGVAIVGLEPSCLLTLRDEFHSLFPGHATEQLAKQAMLFEEFLVREKNNGQLNLALQPLLQRSALLHGHCHQKAFDVMGDVETVLSWIPGLTTQRIESGCCGMAGAFGYEAEHADISLKMAELSLLPAVRAAAADTLIIADGTSCRTQIRDGSRRDAEHVAVVLARALSATG